MKTSDRGSELNRQVVIVEALAEGGSVTLYGCATEAGWLYRLNLIDQSALLLGEPSIEHDSETAHSFEDAIALLDRYPWHRMGPRVVHPEFRIRIWKIISERSANGQLSAHRLDDWRQQCGISGEGAMSG